MTRRASWPIIRVFFLIFDSMLPRVIGDVEVLLDVKLSRKKTGRQTYDYQIVAVTKLRAPLPKHMHQNILSALILISFDFKQQTH